MRTVPLPSDPSFASFSTSLLADEVVQTLAGSSGIDADRVRFMLEMAVGESAQTLRVLQGIGLPPHARVLEVGAGLGVTSAYLTTQGFDVTALEPGGSGFEHYVVLAAGIASWTGSPHAVLTMPAEELDPTQHGRFDLVYSNNVIEHVADPIVLLRTVAHVVDPEGLSVHSCANYSIPYEPHLGIPLVPGRPALTRWLLPRRVREGGLWKSLNFIRAKDVVEAATQSDRRLAFRPAALPASLERLSTDQQFRDRHRAIARVASVLIRIRFVGLLRRLPPTWSTPMDFAILGPSFDETRLAEWRAVNDPHDSK